MQQKMTSTIDKKVYDALYRTDALKSILLQRGYANERVVKIQLGMQL
jgi:hypothetical protein